MRFYPILKRRPSLPTKRMTPMNGCWILCNKPGKRRLFPPKANGGPRGPLTKNLLRRGTTFGNSFPPKRNRVARRSYDQELYKERHLIENFFCKLKQFRAIATRYDKTARNFLAAIYLASTVLWLN